MSEADARLAPVRFRGRGFIITPRWYGSLAAFVIIIAVWQAAGSFGWASPLFLPSPLAILRALIALTASGELAGHIAASAVRIGVGWALGTAAGLAVGLAMGLWGLARSIGISVVSALFPIPKIALLPLLILWLGIGEPSKIATIALGVFFPTVIATYSGVDSVPRTLIRMAQSFDLPFPAIVRKIVIPAALPSILSGFRISASIALLLVVSAEMIGADRGIGAFVLQAGNLMQTDQLLAGVVVLSVFGLIVAKVIGLLEARLLAWR
ncbi:MAG: NitT/TauT family transport system permease protein [Methylobacteriaceae bacterium]|nr:NitT/TauT family transport system permease protein [Methylobacteriaceae bacterium]